MHTVRQTTAVFEEGFPSEYHVQVTLLLVPNLTVHMESFGQPRSLIAQDALHLKRSQCDLTKHVTISIMPMASHDHLQQQMLI